MKLNFDKEKLLKHKFWIMLLVAVPMILAAQFVLLVPVAGEIDKQRKKVEGDLKGAQSFRPTAYNEENLAAKQKEVDESVAKEYANWKKVWEQQDGCRFWPVDFERVHPMQDGKFLRELKYVDAQAEPVKDDEHHFTGKLLERENLYLVIQGKDGKSKERFYRVAPEDMKLWVKDGDKETLTPFFDLPLGRDVTVVYQTGRYFNDKLNDNEQTSYTKSYITQIRPIADIVRPMNDEGEGVVQLKGWLAPAQKKDEPPPPLKALRFVQRWKTNLDVSEDAWLAQEDLWIQKELYRLVRQANDYVGVMDGRPVEGLNQTATYRNLNYQVDLKLLGKKDGKEAMEVTVRNLQNQRQKIDIRFGVKTSKKAGDDKYDVILVDGDPLEPAGAVFQKTGRPKDDKAGKPADRVTRTVTLPNATFERTGIYAVEQMLTWETAAVRRIDGIVIGADSPLGGAGGGVGPAPVPFPGPAGGGLTAGGDIALSHRTFPEGLKPLVEKKVDPAVAADPAAPPGGQEVPGGPRGLPGGPGGIAPAIELGVNGLVKTRYSEPPTEQTRRLPVSISLIVDQAHIDRVLTSFNNSKLRFLTNQVIINRYPLSIRPNIMVGKLNPNPGFMPGGLPFMPPPREGPIGPGPGGPGGPGFGGAGVGGGDEDSEANIELVIYGTVTLYQRFPPRRLPATEEAPKQ